MPKRNVLICNGGGPTAVINLTNMGIVEGCLDYAQADQKIYAAMGGTGALIGEHATGDGQRHVARLDDYLRDKYQRQLVMNTPSTWIGSGRYKLGSKVPVEKSKGDKQVAIDYDISRIIEVCDALRIGHVFFVGGDDTLTTLNAIADYAERHPRDDFPTFLSVPKTIDNDLPYDADDPNPGVDEEGVIKQDGKILCIDACPGFGTAANFVAQTVAHLAVEARALHRHYVIEVMGRDAGFLTAASMLAREFGYGPHLIATPEHKTFDIDAFVELVYAREQGPGSGVYCVSEGIKDETGKALAAGDAKDLFGHARLGGVGNLLAETAKERCGKRGVKVDTRPIRPGEMHRICATFRSSADQEISYNVGHRAAYWALARQKTGKLVTIVRQPGQQNHWRHGLVDTQLVAHRKRELADEWLDWDMIDGARVPDIHESFLDYLRPLVNDICPIAPPFSGSEITIG